MQTNALAAEFGMTGGGVVNLVTKSGTNQIRGTLAEFLRDDALDATGMDEQSEQSGEVSPQLPSVRGHNRRARSACRRGSVRSLTMGATDRSSSSTTKAFATTARSRLCRACPTEMERRGDFSQTFVRTPSGAFIPVQLYDPATTRANPAGAGFVRDPLGTTVIPGARLDPVAMRAIQSYPLPNRAWEDPTGRNNFISNAGTISDSNQYNAGSIIKSADQQIVRPLFADRSREHR